MATIHKYQDPERWRFVPECMKHDPKRHPTLDEYPDPNEDVLIAWRSGSKWSYGVADYSGFGWHFTGSGIKLNPCYTSYWWKPIIDPL